MNKIKVLMIDDNEGLIDLAHEYFKDSNISIEAEAKDGIEGLIKLITANKLTPSAITDYTKVVFKGRLEVITGLEGIKGNSFEENYEEYKKIQKYLVKKYKFNLTIK